MTFSNFQGHAPTAGLLICAFLYICKAVDNTSTDSGSRGPPPIAELPVIYSSLFTTNGYFHKHVVTEKAQDRDRVTTKD